MSAKKPTNVERLEAAEVLVPGMLSPEDKEQIEALSEAEVQHLISTRQKTKAWPTVPGGSPWIL